VTVGITGEGSAVDAVEHPLSMIRSVAAIRRVDFMKISIG
jgi:hypothetical protein